MEIVKKKVYDRTSYRCKCAYCNTELEIEQSELIWGGRFNLWFECCECKGTNIVPIRKILKSEIRHYKIDG